MGAEPIVSLYVAASIDLYSDTITAAVLKYRLHTVGAEPIVSLYVATILTSSVRLTGQLSICAGVLYSLLG